VVRKKAMVILK